MQARRQRQNSRGFVVLIWVLMVLAAVGGCTTGSRPAPSVPHPDTGRSGPGKAMVHRSVSDEVRFWTRALLGGATPLAVRHTRPKTAHVSPAPPRRVGALLFHDAQGSHFCTASVVDSPHHDVIATAAHCVHTGKGGHYQQDVVFAPGYQQGQTPYGVWRATATVVDQRWIASSDPNLDVAFLVLAPQGGKNIGDILGGNKLAVGQTDPMHVRVTGYPNSADTPIICAGRATATTPTQQRFACGGYASGTSGSPWIAHYSAQTHTGQLVGLIGGYQEGGNTPDVSYSPIFGTDVEQLYQQAASQPQP
jgi:V8-like Glu-specific endopeptidase